jgi:hypothetical protein
MNSIPKLPTTNNPRGHPTEFQQVILEKNQNFVGRAFVFTAISNFLHRHNRGYFTIVGAPGSGKSAILAKYVTENPHVIYYNAQVAGKNHAEEFLATICTQIASSGETSLHSLLQQVSDELEPQQKFIIAIDALDAIDRTNQTPGSNLFYLPRYLPRGVYFLLTRRPYIKKKSGLLIEAPSQVLDLAEYPEQNREDVQAYIRQYFTSEQEFITQLTAKSENNFMYLSQILPAICEDFSCEPYQFVETLHATSLQLPGLVAYYQQHFQKMIPPNSSNQQRQLKLSVLSVLVQHLSSVSAEAIARIIDADEYDVEEILENWHEFLILQQIDREIRYSFYHSSFCNFLSKQLTLGTSKSEDNKD